MLAENGGSVDDDYWSNLPSDYGYSFNEDVSAWDVSSVTDMIGMFYYSSDFNQDISAWETSKVKTMANMFKYASSFNSNIEAWDVSRVKSMSSMFQDADSFDSAIGAWDVRRVLDMSSMFQFTNQFNDPTIVAWDVSSVTNFEFMFYYTDAFNVDLSPWDIDSDPSDIQSMYNMFSYSDSFNAVLCWDFDSSYSWLTSSLFSSDGGSIDSSAEKCACTTNEYYDGLSCAACTNGTTSYGKTESCVPCSNALCAPTPAPTASHPPTNSLAPTILKTPINDGTFHEAMRAWLLNYEDVEETYGHISGNPTIVYELVCRPVEQIAFSGLNL